MGYGTFTPPASTTSKPTSPEPPLQQLASRSANEEEQGTCESQKLSSEKFLGGVSNVVFWITFACILWNEFVSQEHTGAAYTFQLDHFGLPPISTVALLIFSLN